MELEEAILTRRTIRKFTDYRVTDNEIKEILEVARWAPSWANTQTWEFIVVRDTDLISRITETYSETNPARPCSFSASAIIICCSKRGIAGCRNGVERTRFNNWFMFDLGMAVQNISLKAHEIGLGSVIVGSMDHDGINKILSLSSGHDAVVAIPVGRPTDDEVVTPSRKSFDDMVYLDQFGVKFNR